MQTQANKIEVKHDEKRREFFVEFADEPENAVLQYESLGSGKYDFYHTYVPPSKRRSGIAFFLSEAAMNWIVGNNYKVSLSCSYLAMMFGNEAKYKPYFL